MLIDIVEFALGERKGWTRWSLKFSPQLVYYDIPLNRSSYIYSFSACTKGFLSAYYYCNSAFYLALWFVPVITCFADHCISPSVCKFVILR